MRTIVFLALLVLGITYVNARGTNTCGDKNCVSSNDGCPPGSGGEGHCCRVQTTVAIYTAVCIRAAASAKATAHASVRASAGVHTFAAATACASAYACITQSVSVSLTEGTCCKINSTISAKAFAYADASAFAAASAWASASAAASAAASATATADAAASLYAFAEATVKSTCCNVHVSLVAQSEASGRFVVSAKVHSEAAVTLAAKARVTASSCSRAEKTVRVGLNVAASVTTNNCCNSTTLSNAAKDSGGAVDGLCKDLEDLHQLVNGTSYAFATAIADEDILTDPTPIQSLIQESACKDALFSCCSTVGTCCSLDELATCGVILQTYISVTLEAKAIVQSYASVSAFVYTAVSAFAYTTVSVRVAVNAAVQASTSITIFRESCCAIKIFINLDARSTATACAQAFAAAQAQAVAYAGAYAQAEASAQAIAFAIASASASAVINFGSCCYSSCCAPYNPVGCGTNCCELSAKAKECCSWDYLKKNADDCAACSRELLKVKDSCKFLSADDSAAVLNAVSTSKLIILQCCCCTNPPATSTTFKSGSSIGGTVFSTPSLSGFPKKP